MILTVRLRTRSATKTLGSTIDAAMARGHDVGLDVGPSTSKDPWQPGDLTRWAALPRRRAGVVIGLPDDADADLGVSGWWDNLLHPPQTRVTTYLSAWHQQTHAAAFPFAARHILGQPIVGWPLADHRALLPPSAPQAAVCFTMKRRIPEPWRRSLRGRLWYHRAIRQAWGRASEWGLPLVFKTRRKHGDPWWLGRYGQIVGEVDVYPATSWLLLAHATHATAFSSGAALEARALGVPCCNHVVPLTHLRQWPGVVASFRHMLDAPLEEVITYDDTKAGARIVDLAETL